MRCPVNRLLVGVGLISVTFGSCAGGCTRPTSCVLPVDLDFQEGVELCYALADRGSCEAEGGAYLDTNCDQRGFTELEDDCGGSVDVEKVYFFRPDACEARLASMNGAED